LERLKFGALFDSGRALLLVGMVVAARTVHVLVAVLRPTAVGLLATAALGVPSAVVSIGLARAPSTPPTPRRSSPPWWPPRPWPPPARPC
jgi:hypothetical protein